MWQRFRTRNLSHLRILATGILFFAAASTAKAYTTGNLVVDPSFESNPLIPYVQILGPPYTTGSWGAEMATISGTASGITPASGALMLSMTDDGLIATQAFQLVDVSAYATDINAGLATVDASALYNVPADVPAGAAAVYTGFYNGANASIGSFTIPGVLDSNVSTWQSLNINAFPVPVGTQYILMQVLYNNASMISSNGASRPGYVDDAMLTLTAVPEPTSIALAATAFVGVLVMGTRRGIRPARVAR